MVEQAPEKLVGEARTLEGMEGFCLAVMKLFFEKKEGAGTEKLLWLLMKDTRPIERAKCHYHEHDELCARCPGHAGRGQMA